MSPLNKQFIERKKKGKKSGEGGGKEGRKGENDAREREVGSR